MAESDVETEALARLDAALDRISQRGPVGIPPAPSAFSSAVADRLDTLIAHLRSALEGDHAALEE